MDGMKQVSDQIDNVETWSRNVPCECCTIQVELVRFRIKFCTTRVKEFQHVAVHARLRPQGGQSEASNAIEYVVQQKNNRNDHPENSKMQ